MSVRSQVLVTLPAPALLLIQIVASAQRLVLVSVLTRFEAE